MSKTITSPVKRWPGTVTISDPLSYPQVFALEDAISARRQLPDDCSIFQANGAVVPGILACVEAWNLENFSPDPFPATPLNSAGRLVTWLWNELQVLFEEAEEAVPLD